MANIAVLGAGLGGSIVTLELYEKFGSRHTISVVNNGSLYQFVPSAPWQAVGWRKQKALEVNLAPIFKKRGINLYPMGAKRLHAAENKIELNDGTSLDYDYLVIATGPELAFDEIEGFGPNGHTNSICQLAHAEKTKEAFNRLLKNPGPVVVGAVQGASCFGPGYEFALILDKALRDARVRDRVPMTFVTSEPYIGHLGLGGVGDTKSLLESKLRNHHIDFICNSRVDKVDADHVHISEIAEDGSVARTHKLPQTFAMMMPAFRGVPAVRDIDGLTNPRGFIIVDDYQRNPTFPNIFSLGVCVAIPPMGKTPVPVGVPKTGFMIETMSTATVHNIDALINGRQPNAKGSWNAICLADFGDGGVAFVAQPQLPPRNVNWSSSGRWVHTAKVGFEKYFLYKLRRGQVSGFYESSTLRILGIDKLKRVTIADGEST